MLEATIAYFSPTVSATSSFTAGAASSAEGKSSRKLPLRLAAATVTAAVGEGSAESIPPFTGATRTLEVVEGEHRRAEPWIRDGEGDEAILERTSSLLASLRSESERNSADRLLSDASTTTSDDFRDLGHSSCESSCDDSEGDRGLGTVTAVIPRGGKRSSRGSRACSLRTSRMGSFLAVVSFWVSHTSSVYATKALLSRPGRTTRGIVVITWCQCVASFFLVLTLGTLGERQENTKGAWRSPLLAEMYKALPTNALLGGWNSKSLLGGGAGPVGLASVLFSLAVFSDNACLGVVNASFFQVARALTLPLVTLFGVISSRSLPPRDLLLPCALCIAGFALGVHSQTPEAFWDGTSMGVMASVLTATYTLLLARAEPREAWRVTYVTNRNASVILVPAAVYIGMGDPTYLSGEPFLLKDGYTMLLAIMATVLPALAGVSTMWQAQAGLGATGQAASFVGRAACSHLLAFYIFGNPQVLVGEVGCCLVLAGLALYASARGGAAVAQAGNVAVPGAARDHLFSPSAYKAGSKSGVCATCGGICGGGCGKESSTIQMADEEAGTSEGTREGSRDDVFLGQSSALNATRRTGIAPSSSPTTSVSGRSDTAGDSLSLQLQLLPRANEGVPSGSWWKDGQAQARDRDEGEFSRCSVPAGARHRPHSRSDGSLREGASSFGLDDREKWRSGSWRGRGGEDDGEEWTIPRVGSVSDDGGTDGARESSSCPFTQSRAGFGVGHRGNNLPRSRRPFSSVVGRLPSPSSSSLVSMTSPASGAECGEGIESSFEDELRRNRGGIFAAIDEALMFARGGTPTERDGGGREAHARRFG